ncbi:unnamed protein product [Hermetia illucens]|uniref:Uncharacterized protein n=1 Tax=Hermetia illucens TaxID=343691 RepID=A0A7R8YVY6_HERIL|nr:uncharacterized protein LOC119651973 [Hermetia illucens]CAD7084285.1 unnamed protein product [Hermetia illucens]
MTSVSTDKERHIVVLMTYHTLVDRDPKYVHYCWGCSVLICMAAIILTAILSFIAAQRLFETFDGNCIYTWNITFESRVESSTNPTPVNAIPTSFDNGSYIEDNRKSSKKLNHIFKQFETDYDSGDNVDVDEDPEKSRNLEISRENVKSEADYNFLTTMRVDIVKTVWASVNFCDYVLYNQVLASISGMICVTMLILYHTAGKAQLDWGLPKPWRIVFPSVIAFGIWSIVSIVHVVIMDKSYHSFCSGLAREIQTKTLGCNKLINALNPLVIEDSWITPGVNYLTHTATIRFTMLGWVTAFLIMLARMMFAIDFRLVRVTISTFSQKRKQPEVGSSSSESIELEQKAEQLDKSVKIMDVAHTERSVSSREDPDEFHSAHSDNEVVVTKLSSADPQDPDLDTQSPEKSRNVYA